MNTFNGKFIADNGSIHYYCNGLPHRVDGPAIEHPNGTKSYHNHGTFHRLDGPAIEYASGRKSYYINGIQYDEETYWIQIHKELGIDPDNN